MLKKTKNNSEISNFLKQQLADNEKVIFISQISNCYILRYIFLSVVVLYFLVVSYYFIFLPIIILLYGYYMKKGEELIITNKRIIHRTDMGLKVTDIDISTIRTTTLNQNIGGIIFNYGTITLDSYITPLNPNDIRFEYIKNYTEFRKTIASLL